MIRLSAGSSYAPEADPRERYIVGSVHYCETCNSVMKKEDEELIEHKTRLRDHRLRTIMIVICGNCGTEVLDVYAAYSPERGQFWCRNCISKLGQARFRAL